MRHLRSLLLASLSATLLACPLSPADNFHFDRPAEGQLSLAGDVEVRIKVPQAFTKKGADSSP